ncbi:uncharacterized protein K489DRAFT_297082, partial [Dissoconium aciculare CBS 342.82]|uniref:UBL3-like ubiquitin domain-containing protein n=1 Tax=Dissoconium aciculare CBS 342.82 TaxID=1314786 RepID=A0A6J3M374_9PEZI
PSPAYLSATGLGPATEGPIAPLPSPTTETNPSTTTTTVLNISLMLTTGARHPYTLDEKYLHSRKVTTTVDKTTGDFDPRLLSGYQLKELIWIDWRSEWEPRPANPSFIRLILMGRMLEDKVALREYPFNLSAVNVVHMTVKPADLHDDDDAAGAGKGSKSGHGGFRRGGGRDDDHEEDDRGAGCRCVIL